MIKKGRCVVDSFCRTGKNSHVLEEGDVIWYIRPPNLESKVSPNVLNYFKQECYVELC